MPHPKRTYRMYFFVPYNLSPIQQGIQAGHAALEYAAKYGNDKVFKDFVFWDKTWIILNGGTSNDSHLGSPKGSMEEIYESLRNNLIPCANFYEPDINNAMTAICFLADERVWDWENFPNFDDYVTSLHIESRVIYETWLELVGGEQNAFLKTLIQNKRLA